jgi:hypothetical protein
MKWFNKWLEKKLCQALENSSKDEVDSPLPVRGPHNKYAPKLNASRHDTGLISRGVNFTLYTANGGTIVELVNYDPSTDTRNTALYVIPSGEDMGQQLAHIVTVEALKR